MIGKIISSSRFITLIAVIGSFVVAVITMLFGAAKIVQVIGIILQNGIFGVSSKEVMVQFIEVIDLFLISMMFYIVALGLYELFIDDSLQLTEWLMVHSLEDLKRKLVTSIIVIMGVFFLASLNEWKGGNDLLILSLSIGIIVATLTFFQYTGAKSGDH